MEQTSFPPPLLFFVAMTGTSLIALWGFSETLFQRRQVAWQKSKRIVGARLLTPSLYDFEGEDDGEWGLPLPTQGRLSAPMRIETSDHEAFELPAGTPIELSKGVKVRAKPKGSSDSRVKTYSAHLEAEGPHTFYFPMPLPKTTATQKREFTPPTL